MNDRLLLGLDIGTTNSKAVVVAPGGDELVLVRRPTPWRRGDDGPELHASDLLACVEQLLGEATAGLAAGRVVAVGVTSMAESGYLVDGGGRALGPALAWDDTRAQPDAAALCEALPDVAGRTGIVRLARTPLVGQRWWRRTRGPLPAGARWDNVADHTVRLLGGHPEAERSLASRTGWLEVDRATWWPEAVEWSGLQPSRQPEIVDAGTPAGHVDARAPAPGAVLTVAGHDHLCAAVGAGAVSSDDIVDSCGTAEVLLRAVGHPLEPGLARRALDAGFTTGWHVIAGMRALVGGFRSGTRLRAAVAALGLDDPTEADRLLTTTPPVREPEPVPLADLDAAIAEAGSEGVRDDRRRAALWTLATTSVAAHASARVDDLTALTGPARRLLVVGGGASGSASRAARRHVQAGAHWPQVREASARGAALLGGIAAGVYDGVPDLPPPPGPPGAEPDAPRPASGVR